ncbi:MAG: 30S ribosome-binding factor RbfA [Bacteroidales bacterium]
MDTKRQEKISRLIQRTLGEIFQMETRHLFGGALITVTHVYVTKDLGLAKIYVSLFATEDKNMLFSTIEENNSEIRGLLGNKIGKQVRKIPELKFYLDDALDQIERIDDLLKE